MEMSVLSDRHLDSVVDWQRAIDAEQFPLRLSTDVQLAILRGFLPSLLRDRQTGFEHYRDNPEETRNVYSNIDFGRAWTCEVSFRWMGDLDELEAAWMAATAYALATEGIVFDPQDGRLYTPQEARQAVRDIQRERPALEAAMRELAAKFSPATR